MSDLTRYANGTRQSITVTLAVAATGAPAVGLTPATVTAAYYRHATAAVAVPLVALAAVDSAHVAGGFKEVDAALAPGLYRVDLPDAATVGGTPDVSVVVKGATIATRTVVVALVPSPARGLTHKYRLFNSFADDYRGPSLVGTVGQLSEAGYAIAPGDATPLSVSNALTTDVHTIVMRVTFPSPAPAIPNYQKLLDFRDRGPDLGLYVSAQNGMDWTPFNPANYVEGAPNTVPGVDVPSVYVLTRDAAGLLTCYVDGAELWTFDDSVERGAVAMSPGNILYILTDDIGGIDNTRTPVLDYLAFYNYAMTATEAGQVIIARDAPTLHPVNIATINGRLINGSGIEGDEFQP